MRALVVGLSGPVVATAALRAARRAEVRARFTESGRARRLPEPARRRLVTALDGAGVSVTPEDAAALWGAAAVGVAVVALGIGAGAVGAVLAGFAAVGAPVVGLRYARAARERALAAAVPGLVDRLAAELRAGATLPGAIAGLARSDHPLASDLRVVEAGVGMGLPPAEALAGWAGRRTTPGVAEVAGALAMCTTVGGRSAEALDGLAAALRDRLAVAAEARALSAQARASAVLVGGAPVVVLAWSALTGGGAVRALLATPTGWVCAALGGGLEGVGAWWMHRIIRSGGRA